MERHRPEHRDDLQHQTTGASTAQYGQAYPNPITKPFDGIIFYANFRPTLNKTRSKSFSKASPTILLLQKTLDNTDSIDDFLKELMGQGATAATCELATADGTDPSS